MSIGEISARYYVERCYLDHFWEEGRVDGFTEPGSQIRYVYEHGIGRLVSLAIDLRRKKKEAAEAPY